MRGVYLCRSCGIACGVNGDPMACCPSCGAAGGIHAPTEARAREIAGLQVPAIADAGGRRSLISAPGAARWHALTVTPQCEDRVESWLSLRGVYGFHPVLKRTRRVMGRLREYQSRYLPGYVFARFHGAPAVHLVTACPMISGAICDSRGDWGVIDPNDLRALHRMRAVDQRVQERRRDAADRRRRAAMVERGDTVLFRAGAFAGMRGEVIELSADGGATVRLTLFGREVDMGAAAIDLVPLRKAC